MNRIYPIIAYAILLHWVWAIALMLDPAAGNATAIHALLDLMPRASAIGVYVAVGVLASIGIWRGCPLTLLPQQFVLMVSAVGAAFAIWNGSFADGVIRSHAFIAADQAPAILAALGHTYAIIAIARNR
jgi:hypothetical protein